MSTALGIGLKPIIRRVWSKGCGVRLGSAPSLLSIIATSGYMSMALSLSLSIHYPVGPFGC